MKKKQLIITVSALGEVTIEGKGFVGIECEKASKAFEDALGVVTDKVKKPDHEPHVIVTHRQTT